MATYQTLIENFGQIQLLGGAIAKSGMFGSISENQGVVIATECYLNDMSPLEYAKRNKIVNGKPFKQYDAMLAEFRERGGDSKILSKTADLASIRLKLGETTEEFSISWQDAQKETYPYLGKEADIVAALARGETPPLKPKYATPGSRATMLFARVVSSSIRAMAPEVNFGCYTPEELDDVSEEIAAKKSAPAKAPEAAIAAPTAAPLTEVAHPLVGADDPTPEPIGPEQPITEELANRLRERARVINQAFPDFTQRLKQKLLDAGVEDGKLINLTQSEGEQLLVIIDTKEAEAVFEMSLRPKSKS